MTESRKWSDVSARLGRNDFPYVLWDAFVKDELFDTELFRGVMSAWTMSEWPCRHLSSGQWQEMMTSFVGDEYYLRNEAVRPRTDLRDTIVLYRGCVEGYESGMSWTDDLEKAKWFANRFGDTFGPVRTITTTVDPEFVLARYRETRGEFEWVLDPFMIEDHDWEVVR